MPLSQRISTVATDREAPAQRVVSVLLAVIVSIALFALFRPAHSAEPAAHGADAAFHISGHA
jgi:hypothetical protein